MILAVAVEWGMIRPLSHYILSVASCRKGMGNSFLQSSRLHLAKDSPALLQLIRLDLDNDCLTHPTIIRIFLRLYI